MFHKIDYHCYFSNCEVYEGDTVELTEEICNAKWLPIPWFKSEFTTSKYLEFAQTLSIITDKKRFISSFFLLKGNKKVKRIWKVKCAKRGVFTIDKVTLIGSDLLGNFEGSLPVSLNIQIVVLPKPIPIEEITASNKYLIGEIAVRHQLIEDPFYLCGIREYTDLDPMNRINWLASAKEQKLMINQNGYTTKQSIQLILNIQSQEYERDYAINEDIVEDCIRVTTDIIYQSLQYNIPICFLSNTLVNNTPVISSIGTGHFHAMNLCRILAHLECKRDIEFDSYLSNLVIDNTVTDIILVTSYLNQAIISFAQMHRNVKIIVIGYSYYSNIPKDCDICSLYEYLKERGTNNEKQPA
ncbi:DUF58 domain-containing protein [Paludicola sp. MB14-C6]|uniref:DUF58 domain-containing protein n=1 Tax=Paludihabitans sp. MB14-C6 TaxID=3070656 RepID=UPI0027DD0519|nr:DUF58 domain-containing protein [Paludicola sp. MB14-C6]WMJ24086.1 DUF58 domain-containing protein [Paludicola sp. MB14-C6]